MAKTKEERQALRDERIANRTSPADFNSTVDAGGGTINSGRDLNSILTRNAGNKLPYNEDGSINWQALRQGQYSNAILSTVGPVLGNIFGPNGEVKSDLYDIPELNIQNPNIQDYMAGGSAYQNAYNQLAPSFWNTYQSSVENPLIARFAGSGSLGSAVGGVSGAAMDTLTQQRRKAENDISARVYESAQTPLLAAYSAEVNRANTQALEPWKATIEKAQYPYQILPGMISGTLPPKTVESSSSGGGGKK